MKKVINEWLDVLLFIITVLFISGFTGFGYFMYSVIKHSFSWGWLMISFMISGLIGAYIIHLKFKK